MKKKLIELSLNKLSSVEMSHMILECLGLRLNQLSRYLCLSAFLLVSLSCASSKIINKTPGGKPEQFKKNEVPTPSLALKGGGGLANMGNTCYFNAAIQLIRNTPDLRARTAEMAAAESASAEISGPSKKEFFKTLNELFQKMDVAEMAGTSLEAKDILPTFNKYDGNLHSKTKGVKSPYGNFANPITNYQSMGQQDSSEFVKPILDALRGDDVRVFDAIAPKGGIHIPADGRFINTPYSDIPIPDGYGSNSFQELVSEAFYVDENVPEGWDGDYKSNVKAIRLLAQTKKGFHSLSLVLKRQQGEGLPKDTTAMIGIEGDITVPFMTTNNPLVYRQKMRVRSFVAHEGEDNGGHYVCYFRDNNDRWFKASDRSVTEVTDITHLNEMMQKTSTMLNFEGVPDAPIVQCT